MIAAFTERHARALWIAIFVAALSMAIAFTSSAGPVVGFAAGLLAALTGVGLFAAAHWATTRDTRLPLAAGKHLPRGSAVVLVSALLVLTLLRETVLSIDVYSSNFSTKSTSSNEAVNGARPPRNVSLDTESRDVRTGFFATCRCNEVETGGYAVHIVGPSACLVPLVKPVDAVMHGEARTGGSRFRIDLTLEGTITGFVSTRACERMIGESLGTKLAERHAK